MLSSGCVCFQKSAPSATSTVPSAICVPSARPTCPQEDRRHSPGAKCRDRRPVAFERACSGRLTPVDEATTRMAAFRWLSEVTDGGQLSVTWAQLQSFSLQGRPVTLVGQRGIWWPAGFTAPISIRTAPPQAGRLAPYDDDITDDEIGRAHV